MYTPMFRSGLSATALAEALSKVAASADSYAPLPPKLVDALLPIDDRWVARSDSCPYCQPAGCQIPEVAVPCIFGHVLFTAVASVLFDCAQWQHGASSHLLMGQVITLLCPASVTSSLVLACVSFVLFRHLSAAWDQWRVVCAPWCSVAAVAADLGRQQLGPAACCPGCAAVPGQSSDNGALSSCSCHVVCSVLCSE
jgi:hypothetical protein